jgi:hypothetical protein
MKQAGWSDSIELDAAGTNGELHCKKIILNTSIDSLAGPYHRSSLVTISPRYIVKNMLHISITMIPVSGSQRDVIRKARSSFVIIRPRVIKMKSWFYVLANLPSVTYVPRCFVWGCRVFLVMGRIPCQCSTIKQYESSSQVAHRPDRPNGYVLLWWAWW